MIHDQQRPIFLTKSTSKEKKLLRNRSNLRRLMVESLEDRRLLNVDWRNPVDSIDVDNDGSISPLDALVVINYINAGGSGTLPAVHALSKPYLDVDGDQSVSPLDVLNVINHLNAKGSGARSLKEVAGQLVSETDVTITLGQTSGTRDYRVRIDNQFDTTDQSAALEDLLAVYLVDPLQPTTTLLDRGTNGTALFTLAGTKAEFVPGRVSWDGSVLDINLSDLALSGTGLLKFQLLNSDSDGQTKVSIVPLTNQIDIEGTNGPKLSLDGSPVAAGTSATLANLTPMANGQLQVGNVRYDSSTGKYNAEIRLRNDGDALGRNIAVVFPGLPAGVSLRNPSGTTAAGEPYINLKPAIQRGGLTHGSWSEPVAVEFNNPGQVLFVLKPKILAATNHAPTLATIAPLTVMPGGVLKAPLTASDEDGDPIAFSLVNTGATIALPTGSVDSSGVLTFRPKPSQLGTYQFDVIASDGALAATRSVVLNVIADPITTTRVSGKILKVDGQPLAGMPIQIGSVQGLTLADGSFTLDLGFGTVVSDTVKVRGELFSGPIVYPFIAEKLAFILEHDVYANVNNVIDRPIYLPALNVAGGTKIDPMLDVAVRQQVAPGEMAEIFVAASTLTNLQGTPFTGTLSITEVPTNFTPASLPFGMNPDLVVTIQPGEMVFARPAPLSLPNRSGRGPRVVMDLWSINPITGQFEDVGNGQVSADGKTVETISGGVRNSSWHFFSPPAVTPERGDPYNKKNACNRCEVNEPFNSEVELHSGAVVETHALASYQTQGSNSGLRLVFNSLRADPRPIVHFGFDDVDAKEILRSPELVKNLRLVARMSVERGTFTTVVPGRQDKPGNTSGNVLGGDEHYWRLPDEPASADAALQVDLRDQPTGVYRYRLDSGIYYFTGSIFSGSSARVSGNLVVVNSRNSPFGAGWGIAGLQHLVENDDKSVLLIDGDGSELLFAFNQLTGSYTSPAGDFSKLEKIQGGTYQRTLADRTVYRFDSNLNLLSITDTNNNRTQFSYNAQGAPTGIIDPTGQVTTFLYSGKRVSEIRDPAGRTTRLDYDNSGNLLRVTDPDSAVRNWQYDTSHHMVGEIDPLGRQEQSSYGFHGRATGANRKDGTQIRIQAPETQGLFPADATIDYMRAPTVFSLSDKPTAMYVDGKGNVRINELDAAGQATKTIDAIGNTSSVLRNADNLPVESVNAQGSVRSNIFDNRGNLVSSRDSLSVRLGDEPSMIGILSGDLLRQGERDRYSFVAKAGERIWIDSIRGSASIEIITPSGNALSTEQLPENGTYQVIVSKYQGTYAAAIRSRSYATQLEWGVPVSRNVDAGEDVVYRFTAERNQRFVLHDGTIAATGDWLLKGPNDEQVKFLYYQATADYEFLVPMSGEYYLIHTIPPTTSTSPQTLEFTAKVVDPTPVSASGFGTTYDGTLQPGEQKRFSFTGAQAAFVYLDNLGERDQLKFELRDPQDRPLAYLDYGGYGGLLDNRIFQLTSSGTYQLVVSRKNASLAGSYQFRIENLSSAPIAQFDSVVKATVTGRQATLYRLTGSAGERFLIESSPAVSMMLFLSSVSPYGYASFVRGIYTLPVTGDYYLIFDGSEAFADFGKAEFSFSSIDLKRMPLIALDDDITGTVTATGQRNKYYRFLATPGNPPKLLNLPNVTSFTTPQIMKDVNLRPEMNETGEQKEYVLFADAYAFADFPHQFGFRLIGPSGRAETISYGQTMTGRIGLNQTDTYTFNGVQGTSIYLDWRNPDTDSNSGVVWSLIGPDGKHLIGPDGRTAPSLVQNDFGPVHLPSTGTYRLELSYGNRLSNYEFRLFDTASAMLVSLGSPLGGRLTKGSAANLFQLSAAAGQRLRFEQSSTTSQMQIYSPSGELVFDSGTVSEVKFAAISETGKYLIVVSGREPNVRTPLSFEWSIFLVNDLPVIPTGFDVLYQGTAVEGDLVATFQGNAGSQILFRTAATFDIYSSAAVRIVGPSGETVKQFVPQRFTLDSLVLPQNGQYTAHLIGRSGPLTRPTTYEFVLSEVSSLPKLELGTIHPVPPGLNTFPFTFEVTAGGQYLLEANVQDDYDASSIYDPYRYFYVSASLPLDSQGIQPGIPFTALKSGTYQGFAKVNYSNLALSLQLLRLDAAPILPPDTVFKGTNSRVKENVVRRMDVQAGETWLLRSNNKNWVVYDPAVLAHLEPYLPMNWARVERTSGQFVWEGVVSFPNAGTFALIRRGAFGDPLEYSVTVTRLEEPVVPMVGGNLSRTDYTYDPVFNQLTSLTDEQGRRTLFERESVTGNVLKITKVVGAPGGNDDLKVAFTYQASGQINTVTDPLGRTTAYDYDSKGRLISQKSVLGTPLQAIQTFEYDAAGNLSAMIDEKGDRTVFEYDSMNRRTQITMPDPDGSGPLPSPTQKFTYDAVGNLLAVTDALGGVTRKTYDALDRLTSVTDSENNVQKYAYDQAGNVTSITDSLGHVSRFRYDARNRLSTSIDAANFETHFKYDLDNNLISLTDPMGNSTKYAYDSRNRRIAEYDPLGRVTSSVYNGVNEIIAQVDRLGRTTRLTYDDVGRVIRERWLDAQNIEVNTVNYTYDADSRLVRVQDGVSDLQATYDALDRPTREQTGGANGVPTTILDHTYDAIGNVLSTTDTINGTVGGTNAYVYDSLDRLTKLTQSSAVGSTNPVSEKRVDLSYNALGQFTSLARFADMAGLQSVARTSFAYDTLNRLTDISHRNPANAVLDSFAFSYDTASRISRISDIDGATDYAYDVRDQLSVANHADIANPDEAYVYDGTGNRTSSQRHGSGYVVGDGVAGTSDNNRLTSDGTYRYVYDAEGNLITRTQIAGGAVREFAWDNRNRLTRVTDRPSTVGAPTQVVDYIYDTLNRRIASKVDTTPSDAVDGKITYFVYDGSDVLVELVDLDGSGPAVAAESMRYLHGPAVDQIFAQENAAGDVLWDLTDHLGTVRDLVNNSGQVVNHIKYDSYGNVVSESNPVVKMRYKYTGREFDAETGMQYNRARYYDATVGRFLSEDPIGFAGGSPNVYSYVVNWPNQYRDPSGYNPLVAAVGAGIGYDAGYLANVAGQLAGGTNLADVDTDQALIAGGVGAVAGALATNKGLSKIGALGLGAAANLVQYVLTTDRCEQNLENAIFSLGTGFVGAYVGGGAMARAALRPVRSRFMSAAENSTGGKVPESMDTMRRMATNRNLNEQALGATYANVGRGSGGAGVGAIAVPFEKGGQCDCK